MAHCAASCRHIVSAALASTAQLQILAETICRCPFSLDLCCSQALRVIQLPPLSAAKAWALLPVTLLYISNVALALLGLQTLNIPMYNTLKRLTPVLVLGAKVWATDTDSVPAAAWGSSEQHTWKFVPLHVLALVIVGVRSSHAHQHVCMRICMEDDVLCACMC